MGLSLVLAVLAMVVMGGVAEAAELPMFGEFKYGMTVEQAKTSAEDQGYVFMRTGDYGDVCYAGMVLNEEALVFLAFANGTLEKIVVTLVTEDPDAIPVYKRMKRILTERYGKPTSEYEFYHSPYYEGDGFEQTAIRVGKGSLATFWGVNLSLNIERILVVVVTYESPKWDAESDRKAAWQERVFGSLGWRGLPFLAVVHSSSELC